MRRWRHSNASALPRRRRRQRAACRSGSQAPRNGARAGERAESPSARRACRRLQSGETAEIEAIIRWLTRDGITVVLVEHDMRLVMNVSDRVHVLANGRTLAEGTAAEVRANPAVIEAYLGVRGARESTRAVG